LFGKFSIETGLDTVQFWNVRSRSRDLIRQCPQSAINTQLLTQQGDLVPHTFHLYFLLRAFGIRKLSPQRLALTL
jgi:hypothetical protein